MCHCTQCRRMTGHIMAATAARRADFSLVSDGELKWYVSSVEARRGFCGRCGSTLFWEGVGLDGIDRKSTRLNSSHGYISYAVFCLKKKNPHPPPRAPPARQARGPPR